MLFQLVITLLIVHSEVLGDGSSNEEPDSHEHDSAQSSEHHWGYQDQQAWSTAFKDCNGKSQSPIDIETGKAIYKSSLPAFKLEGYDLTGQAALTLQNNGHTLLLSLPNTMRIVRGFDQVYLANQLHFHWGTVEVPGSEHTIDDVHFPAEIHVVHYNSKYPNISVAASKPDGLAVLGGFIGIGLHENENYEKILSVIKNVSIQKTNAEIQGFNVRHLLPKHLDRFYRYTGSLTTPPCFQSVNWTVFNETIKVSRRQLAALEDTLKVKQNQLLSKNFRTPQLLHGRQVLASFTVSSLSSKASMSSEDNRFTNLPTSDPKDGFSRGDLLAVAFGSLFAVTLLAFFVYAYQQRKKFKNVSRQNVVYKPTNKDEV